MSNSAGARALFAIALGVGAFGLAFVVLPGPIEGLFNRMIFGSAAAPETFSAEARDYIRFSYGVIGAVMAGWMALIGAIALGPLRRGERWAWEALAGSIAFWFVVDTAHSLATGYPENALLNVGFVIAFAVPLYALRPRGTP